MTNRHPITRFTDLSIDAQHAHLRRLAVEEAFHDDIPAGHALDGIRTPEAMHDWSSGAWKHPARKPERFDWSSVIIGAIGIACIMALTGLVLLVQMIVGAL